MRRIKVGLTVSAANARLEDGIDVEDDATAEEVDGATEQWALDHIDWWHE